MDAQTEVYATAGAAREKAAIRNPHSPYAPPKMIQSP
jgi:hypothetical protein